MILGYDAVRRRCFEDNLKMVKGVKKWKSEQIKMRKMI